jgi:O-antigen ligase
VTLAAVATAVAAVNAPGPAAAAVAALAVAGLAFARFEAAVGLFTALTFFERAPGFTGTVSIVKLMTLVLVLAWALPAAAGRRQPGLWRDRPLVVAWMLVLLGWAAASALWAADVPAAQAGAFRLLQMLVIVFLVFAAVRRGSDLRVFAWSFIGGAVLTSLVPLFGFGPAAGENGERFGGYLGNPNNLAAVVLPALALAAFMLIGSSRRLEQVLLGVSCVILLVTLVLTQSRGGLVGLVTMAVVALLFAGPVRKRAVHLLLLGGLSIAAYFWFFASVAVRERATAFSGSESTGRIDLWHVSLRMFSAHPLHGVGLDNFTVLAPGYLASDIDIQRADLFLRGVGTQVHNTYMTVLVELGLVGEIAFIGFLVAVAAIGIRAVRVLAGSSDRESELIGRGLVVGAAGMLAAYVFFSAQYEKQLWLILGALLSLSTLAAANAPRRRMSSGV